MGIWQFSSWNSRSLFNFRNSTEISQEASNRRLEISAVTKKPFYHLYFPLIEHKSQLGSHTVTSRGIAVATTHMYDWLILILLAAMIALLNLIHPFSRYVGKNMTDLTYPLKDNTVPFWAVPVYAVLFPMAVFLAFYFRRRDVYDLHHAILGLLFSVLLTGVITDAIKDAVGRPRPDFFWRCFPDGKDIYDEWGDVICHGDRNVVREGHKSFPSEHTSWSFAGLGFLSLYLSGKIRVFDRKGHVAKLCIVFFPLLFASLVGVSRVDDYRGHWQDVFAGGLIGYTMSVFCYLQFFAPPYHAEGWGPYAFFRALEESRSNAQESEDPLAQTDPISAECQIEAQQNDRNNNLTMGSSLRNSHLAHADLESGIVYIDGTGPTKWRREIKTNGVFWDKFIFLADLDQTVIWLIFVQLVLTIF